jgi:hypothetical protein
MFPILPGMDFSWVDPEGTPNRRWRAVMSREVWQQVVNIRLYGSHPPPPGTPQLFLKKPRKQRATGAQAVTPELTKKRRMRRRRIAAPTT